MRKLSNLSLVSPASLRTLLIERMRKDPELFLLENQPLDISVIANIINGECTTAIDAYNRSMDDNRHLILEGVENHPCNMRMARDLEELRIPFRIALTGWLLLPEFALPGLCLRLYKYAVGESTEVEQQTMFEYLANAVKANYLDPTEVTKMFKNSKLTQYIQQKLSQ